MTNTILGVFDDPAAARRAMDDLRASPLELQDISIIARGSDGAVSTGEHLSAGEGAAVGAVWGGLVGLAALLIPGVGPFIAGGALFAALTGAAAGAVVGGIAGALIDAGISEEEARGYEAMVHSGKTLIAVKARDEDATEVRRILAGAGANSIRDNQTDITGSTAAVSVGGDRNVERELEAGATSVRGASGLPAMEPPVGAATVGGMRGIYDVPATYVAGGVRGIYDTPSLTSPDDMAAARTETTNMASGTEDPYGTRQVPPGDVERTIVTEGWDRVGYAGDRQGEELTPPERRDDTAEKR
jgi:uncharacterized membrane protein